MESKIITYQYQNKRSQQEDRLLALEARVNGFKLSLLAVADGMGGYKAGDLAAETAISELKKLWIKYQNEYLFDNWNQHKANLQSVFFKINSRLKDLELSGEGSSFMGTTLTCALIIDGRMIVGNIGDSRCYVFTKDRIDQLTKDHSAYQDAIDKGISINDLNVGKNAITRSLNTNEECVPDIYPYEKDYYDVNQKGILLSTDGMHSTLIKKDIFSIIFSEENYDEAAINLASSATNNGSTDNISIVLLIPDNWISEKNKKSKYRNLLNLMIADDKINLIIGVVIILVFSGIIYGLSYRYEDKINSVLVKMNDRIGNNLNIDIDENIINEDFNGMTRESLIRYIELLKSEKEKINNNLSAVQKNNIDLRIRIVEMKNTTINKDDVVLLLKKVIRNDIDNNRIITTSVYVDQVERFIGIYTSNECLEMERKIPINLNGSYDYNRNEYNDRYGRVVVKFKLDNRDIIIKDNICFSLNTN